MPILQRRKNNLKEVIFCYNECMKYDKLVRDNILEILENKNIKATYHIASNNEYKEKLHEKLLEEVYEFNENPSNEEMADIIEVINAIKNYYSFTDEDIEKIRSEKSLKRGAFNKKIILEETFK